MDSITGFVDRVIRSAGGGIESVVFSPLPFIEGQLLVVCAEDGPFIPDLVAAAYGCDPPELAFHWLRASELRQLAQPFGLGVYMTKRTGGYPGFCYWLKYEGRVLGGVDVRSQIPLPQAPHRLLRAHLLANITWGRNHLILDNLVSRSFAPLIEELGERARHLAATALLQRGVWRVERGTVFDQLGSAFDDPELIRLTSTLTGVFPVDTPADDEQPPEEELEERAYEAAWTHERFISCLRRYAE